MNINVREVSKKHLNEYAQIPMWLKVTSKYDLNKIDGGLGGIILNEIKVQEYIKDLSLYEKPLEWEK